MEVAFARFLMSEKAKAKSSLNTISLLLPHRRYFPGEKLKGQVHLDLKEPIPKAISIKVIFRGIEQASLGYHEPGGASSLIKKEKEKRKESNAKFTNFALYRVSEVDPPDTAQAGFTTLMPAISTQTRL
jgi:hypothetical protein